MLRARLLDLALAAVCVGAGQVELRMHVGDGVTAGPLWLNTVVLLVVDLAVLGWRVAPGPALFVMAMGMLLPSLFTAHAAYFWTTILPALLVVFRNASRGDGRFARWGWLLAVVGLSSVSVRTGELVSNLVTVTVFFGGGSLAGRLVRRGEVQRDQLETALADLAVEQSHRQDAAAQTERNRIATETHDLVAHAVSEMVLQVGAARMSLQAVHATVPDQLAAAEDTGRRALADLRRSLGLLPDHPDRGLSPVPGIAALEGLVSGFRESGLDVRLARATGGLEGLPSGLQLAVHRVLQESLTNARKHAGCVRVDVCVERIGPDLVLEVRSAPPQGDRASLPSGGHGLIGMRERVTMFGGQLIAAPDDDGAFRVRATWPVPLPTPSGASR